MDRSLVTILVIDESVMVRRVLETLLERDGFSVLSVRQRADGHSDDEGCHDRSGADGCFRRTDRNEIVQTTEMRREFPDIKVIAMSGFFGANPPLPSRLRAHACLSKPIRPEALRNSCALFARPALDPAARRPLKHRAFRNFLNRLAQLPPSILGVTASNGSQTSHNSVVDDEPLVRHSLEEVLRLNGFQVLQAGDGDEALDVLASAEVTSC